MTHSSIGHRRRLATRRSAASGDTATGLPTARSSARSECESAYAYELRGSRRRQARENLKKLRSMIRRAQNRGYATLARIAEHLERLAVGDEANAAIDAVDGLLCRHFALAPGQANPNELPDLPDLR